MTDMSAMLSVSFQRFQIKCVYLVRRLREVVAEGSKGKTVAGKIQLMSSCCYVLDLLQYWRARLVYERWRWRW
jgi:hypothetical protein